MAANLATLVLAAWLISCMFLPFGVVQGATVPAIFVFGDSLGDVGTNDYVNTTRRANFPHYGVDFPGGVPTGRFSNGYNGADFLAKFLGFKQSPPPYLSMKTETQMLQGGANFASGGSGILDSTGTSVSFTAQLAMFKNLTGVLASKMGKDAASSLLAKSFFLITTGNNDMFGFYARFGPQNDTVKDQFIATLMDKFEEQLKTLYELGARKIAIQGTSHIGCLPAVRSTAADGACAPDLNSLARRFNKAAKPRLHHLSLTLEGFEYAYGNVYKVVSTLQSRPRLFGFKEKRAACCGGGRFNGAEACTPNSTYCSDRGEYFYWDGYHPTQATNKIVTLMTFSGSRKYATPINFKQLAEY